MQDRVASFRLPARIQDLLLALFVTVMQVQGTVVRNSGQPDVVLRPLSDLGNLGYLLLIVSGAALAVRRRHPAAVFAVTALTSVVYYGLDFPDGPGWLALFVALYTFTAYGDGHRTLQLAGGGIVALAVVWLIAAADVEPPAAVGWVYFRIGASVMSAALGESVRARKHLATQALERAALAERARDEEARARVDAERLRIAREVHDTVAHAIAVINIQSGVTAHVLDKRPERVRESLEVIEQTSARALAEMRAILDVLRAESSSDDVTDGGGADDLEPRAPRAGVAQLDDLTARAREAGLEVTIDAPPPPQPLPAAVGSAVYRIVQEAITNVIRHVGTTRVTISLQYSPDTVEVRVSDEGRPTLTTDPRTERQEQPKGPGHGLTGMRERCRLLGGRLDAGPLPHGGFAVTARLPVTPTEATTV
ncbi:sensor histidine kinase [Rhodococcus coprophilus]|nr:sensor histidine kinase [Rhodococcus coprophilus]MBM7460825.1 signal transduction histidine kinase [Rhodococcus coprophilus]